MVTWVIRENKLMLVSVPSLAGPSELTVANRRSLGSPSRLFAAVAALDTVFRRTTIGRRNNRYRNGARSDDGTRHTADHPTGMAAQQGLSITPVVS